MTFPAEPDVTSYEPTGKIVHVHTVLRTVSSILSHKNNHIINCGVSSPVPVVTVH